MTTEKTSLRAEDSLSRRYIIRLISSAINLPFAAVMQGVLARASGAVVYGDFTFLSKFFSDALTLLDGGAITAFFSKYSRHPEQDGLVSFYFRIVGYLSIALILLLCAIEYTPLRTYVWPDYTVWVVALPALYALLLWLMQFFQTIVDARALTVRGEVVRLIHRVVVTGMMITIFLKFRSFSFSTLSWIQIGTVGFIVILMWVFVLGRRERRAFWIPIPVEERRLYFSRFIEFCSPLLIYNLVALGVGFLDRWVLQQMGGARQQGYFGLSTQLSTVSFLFTSSMASLLTRELSKAFGEGRREYMADLFDETAKALYTVAAVIGVFAYLESRTLTLLLGGSDFADADIAVGLMLLYPMHQTYGQLNASVFFANAKTGIYRNVGVFALLVGIPLSFFLLLPRTSGGLQLGATGLAIKLVGLQLLQVNIQLFLIARMLGLSWGTFFRHQITTPLCLFSLIGTIQWIGRFLELSSIAYLFFVSFFYATGILIALHAVPSLLGIRRARVDGLKQQLRLRIFHASGR